MTLMNVNLWSVLVAGVATMVVGFLWYSPILFARPWMVAMGYDPEDKAKIQEMQKSAGKSYAISFVASLVSAFVLGKIIHDDGEHRPVRNENRLCHLARLCHHRTAHGKTVRQPIHQAVFDQYRVPVGVLSGDGSNPGGVALVNQSSVFSRPSSASPS
jgi:hypothetical protein